jgi:hypothetical protein
VTACRSGSRAMIFAIMSLSEAIPAGSSAGLVASRPAVKAAGTSRAALLLRRFYYGAARGAWRSWGLDTGTIAYQTVAYSSADRTVRWPTATVLSGTRSPVQVWLASAG